MIDLKQIVNDEAERVAYMRGQTQAAALYARIHDLERKLGDAQTTVEQLTEDVDRLHQELRE